MMLSVGNIGVVGAATRTQGGGVPRIILTTRSGTILTTSSGEILTKKAA